MSTYTLFPTYVQRNADGASIPLDESNRDYNDFLAWCAEGNTPDAPPPPTFADYQTAFMALFTQWIEDVAHQNQYDSSLSCRAYYNSTVPQFKGDAVAFSAWIDNLWVWASNWQAGFNGAMPNPIPSWEEVKALAPQPEAYGWVVHTPGEIIEAQQQAEMPL